MKKLPLILFLVMTLLGCQTVHPTVPPLGAVQGQLTATSDQRTIVGRVDFNAIKTTQALPSDVVTGSTVSFIDSTNTTVVTGKTDVSGNFSLNLGTYSPTVGGTYILEAIKGLSNQAPGVDAARFRTFLQWTGTGWLSCTNATAGGGIVINALTTAVAIESAFDPVNIPPTNTMGKVNATPTPPTLNATPGPYSNHPDSQITQLSADLLTYLGTNSDPLSSVPSILPTIGSLNPTNGTPGTLVLINGSGFSIIPTGNTVTFNGVQAQILLATQTFMIVVVPSNATSGPIQVQTTRGTVTGPSFTVSNGFGSFNITGFSPTYGRPDTVVTLSGAFGTGTSTPSVFFAGPSSPVQAAVSAWTPSSMTVTVPVGAVPGTIKIQSGTTTASSVASFNVWNGDVSLMTNIYNTNPGTGYTMSQPLSWQAGVATGSYYYVTGGNLGSGYSTAISDVRMYPINADGSLGTAKAVGEVNIPRSTHAAVIYGNYLYVIGGLNTSSTALGSIERATINPDGTISPFTQVGSLQTARYELSAFTYGNCLYVLGGMNNAGTPLNTVERYTINADGSLSYINTYTITIAGSAATLYACACTVVGNGVVIAGGVLNGSTTQQTETIPINGDGTLGNGVVGPNMGVGLNGPSCAVYNNELYVISGSGASNVVHATLNPTNGTFTTGFTSTASQLYCSFSCNGALLTGNRLYTFGGYNGGGLAVIQTATINADKSITGWAALGGMQTWRDGQTGQLIGNKIWTIGGYTSVVLSSTEYFTIESNGTLGPATYGPSLNTPRYGPSSFVANGYLYVLGGTYNAASSGTLNTIERATINADGTLGAFAVLPQTLNVARAWAEPNATVIGNYVYLFGGQNLSGAYINTIERATVNPDGSLSQFQLLGNTLPDASGYYGAPVVIGNYLYLVGENAGGATGYVFLAPINADGTIGAFTRGPSLLSALYSPSVARIGNYLYCFGGYNTTVVQRALISPDGTLNAWQYDLSDRYVLPNAVSYVASPYVYGNFVYMLSNYGPTQTVLQGTIR